MSIGKVAHNLAVVLLVTAVAFATAAAQETSKTEATRGKQHLPESTSLWRVETDSSTVYLMGSIHLLKETDFPLHPKMLNAFDEAGTLVLEVEPDSAKTPAFQQYVLAEAVYDSGKTLRTELGDSVYNLLGTQMESVGLALDQMKQFEPWMVALTFLGLKVRQLGFDPDFGVDVYFYEQAKAQDKAIAALETPEYQIGVLASMSSAFQRALVLQTLEEAGDLESAMDEIVLHWRTGDLDGLEATVNRSLEDFPEIRDLLLTERNHTWIPKIEAYVRSRGTCLIIMGAAHMSGDDGIVALLRQAGYQVEQM